MGKRDKGPHATHAIFLGTCLRCLRRASSLEIKYPCGTRIEATSTFSLEDFEAIFQFVAQDFARYWREKFPSVEVQTVDEWFAELQEYRKQHKNRS